MAKQQYCPLKFSADKLASSETYYCDKRKCAWWDNLAGLCAILVIAQFGEEGSFYRHRQEQKEALDAARGT